MKLIWESRGWADYLYWQENDRKMVKRINNIIRDMLRDPREGIGNPEPLRENLSGLWSRRITEEHRIVYDITAEDIRIISCKWHYK